MINLYDIQHPVVGNEEIEPSVLERVVVPGSSHSILSYSWHESDENRFLCLNQTGKCYQYCVVFLFDYFILITYREHTRLHCFRSDNSQFVSAF